MKKGVLFAAIVIFLVLGAPVFAFSYKDFFNSGDSFETNKILIKSVIKEKEIQTTNLKITNLNEKTNFKISINNLNELIELNENDFVIDKNEEKEITITFNGSAAPGVYSGSLEIKNDVKEKIIPVILEIQTKETYFAVSLNVNSISKEIESGKISPAINFVNLRDSESHSAEVEFKILDLNGKEIVSEKENITIGSKSSVTKSINLPKDAKSKNYVLAVVLNFENYISTSSYLFSLKDKTFYSDFFNINIFLFLVFILLVVIVFIIIYILRERNKLFSDFKKQQKSELKFYSEKIEGQKAKDLNKAKTDEEKKKILDEFGDAKNKIINEIKKEQKKQIKEIKKINYESGKDVAKKKIKQWRKQIYSKAVKSAEINSGLKMKLAALKKAYTEGYISRESYRKGESRIKSATKGFKSKSL